MGAGGGVWSGAMQGVMDYTPKEGGVGRRRMGRRRGMAGQCKKQGRQEFLVGLVRGCTTGFAAWAAAAHGQNHLRHGKLRLYRITADFEGDTRREPERQRRNTDPYHIWEA